MNREIVEHVLTELGSQSDFLAVEGYESEDTWLLYVDEETLLKFDLDKEAQVLVLSATIAMPVADRTKIYELLLQYNGLWSQSGGLVMTLDETLGNVGQLCRLNSADCIQPRLRSIVDGFIAALRTWREFLVRKPTDQGEETESLMLQGSGFIRA